MLQVENVHQEFAEPVTVDSCIDDFHVFQKPRECCLLHKKICLGMKGFPSSMWTRHRKHSSTKAAIIIDIESHAIGYWFRWRNIILSCCCFAIINKNYYINSTFLLHRVAWHSEKMKRCSEESRKNMILFVCCCLWALSLSLCMKVECENKVKCPTGLKMVFENHILFLSLLSRFVFFPPLFFM